MIKQLTLGIVLVMWGPYLFAQEQNSPLDFRIGSWRVSWETPQGITVTGNANISRVVGGKVIQELIYEVTGGEMAGFEVMNLAQHNVLEGKWYMTWVDSQGGYMSFVSEGTDNPPVFTRKVSRGPRAALFQRIRYEVISPQEWIWRLENSRDEGKTWQLMWEMQYLKLGN